MTPTDDPKILKIGIPKGRMFDGVQALLADAGIRLSHTARSYRPHVTLDGTEVKILKAQNIVEMLHAGSRDLGFAGADWVAELNGELVELVDTALDPVQVVAAAPADLLDNGSLPSGPLVVASEYERLTRRWIADRDVDATFVRSFGATEVFPPEDADLIVDNAATGSTLEANKLEIVDRLMTSSTRLYACPRALEDAAKRERIEQITLLVQSVLEARRRVMVEVNVAADALPRLLAVLPCMRQPTVATLADDSGFAVKAAVPRTDLPTVIPRIRAAGGTDIVVTRLAQIVA